MISTEALVYILALLSVIAIFLSATKLTQAHMIVDANKGASMLLTNVNALHYTVKS